MNFGDVTIEIGMCALSDYDEDGHLQIQTDSPGLEGSEGTHPAEALAPGGVVMRPLDPDKSGDKGDIGLGSPALIITIGDLRYVVPLLDPRDIKDGKVPKVKKGGRMIAGGAGEHRSFFAIDGEDPNGTNVAGSITLMSSYSKGGAKKSLGISLNVRKSGEEDVSIVHGDGQRITLKDEAVAREVMLDLAKLSKATGASVEDMFDAAGDVSNALGETDHKGEKVKAVMASIAAMGKEGAVEVKDLATQMSKLGAASGQFQGDHARVMAEMSALAQMSRAKGGSASATQAATSVLSFANTFDKGAREKAFQRFGVQTRDTSGRVRDLRQIILDSIRAASSAQHGGMGAFSTNMGQMFMDARARSATRGFESVFKDAGGGEAGMQAVAKAFDDLANATMNQTEVNASFAAAMSTSDAKAKVFNEEMAKTTAELQQNLLPAMQALAPAVKDATAALAAAAGALTGETKNRQDAAGRRADATAQDARITLSRGAEKGSISSKEVADAERSLADLDAQIAAKKENKAKSAGFLERTAAAVFDFGPFGRAVNAAVGGHLGADYVQAKEERKAQDEGQLRSMAEERAQLGETLRQIKDGTLKVEIVADRTAALPQDRNGVSASPEEKARRR